MLWHRTQDRGSSPLLTHSEYFNSRQRAAARLTTKREQGMFIDRCGGARGMQLQRDVRYPLAISLRLSLSHPNVSLMCTCTCIYLYMCVSPCSLDKALRIPPPTPEHQSVRMFRELNK
ncbi:hypothetical protein ALC62_13852 [Cyphomyrmex costatus]|uniref:Uncharacterized protein n=1 Tax=Cyphomyrmex costatus TaxID=456900 RepID=A0A195C3I1_9HYME|nr:hypothetical protein ALC62_13852 [Cyphomyrmex costatus]